MMPKVIGSEELTSILTRFCNIKNVKYKGEAGLQLSINSTDEYQRNRLFRNRSMPLKKIPEIASLLPMP